MVVRTLVTLRSDDSFELFWLKVTKRAESLELEPQLPRRTKRPRRYDDGLAESEFHDDPMAYFRQHYFEALDLAVNCIKDRFDQPGYKVYSNLEQLLLKVIEGADVTTELDFVNFIRMIWTLRRLKPNCIPLEQNFCMLGVTQL
jgi:hypothetical protein